MATQVSDRPAATTQDRVIVLKSAEDTAGELFKCEYIALVVSPEPRDHIHTHQEERLEVVEGRVRCRVAGKEYVLERMLADARLGDVALFMSNGPFDGLKERFLAALKGREG